MKQLYTKGVRARVAVPSNPRKTECGASLLLTRWAVRAAPFALLGAMLLTSQTGFAQFQDETHRIDLGEQKWYSRFTHNYQPGIVRPISLANSSRLDSLIRAGNLYLSLQDAIALSLENNIDIEVQRYNFT